MIGFSAPMGDMVNYFVNYKGQHCVSVRHLFGATYVDTLDELVEIYQPMIEWLDENIKSGYKLSPIDNCAYSDVNEDPWIGYMIYFQEKTDAMAFKLQWA